MREFMPRPLTAEAFAPFGEVIEAGGEVREINDGHTRRFHDLASLDVGEQGGRAIVSLFRAEPLTPLVLRIMERRRLSSPAFMPLQGRPWLVVVAPAGPFDPWEMQVFRAEGTQGVNYRRGVWRHFLLPLATASDFPVIDREGPGDGCDEVELSPADQATVRL
jgi:ureidoglycolate lyase